MGDDAGEKPPGKETWPPDESQTEGEVGTAGDDREGGRRGGNHDGGESGTPDGREHGSGTPGDHEHGSGDGRRRSPSQQDRPPRPGRDGPPSTDPDARPRDERERQSVGEHEPRARGGQETAAPTPEGDPSRRGQTGTQEKDPGVSAVLSFFIPGVGQVYNGQVGRGAVVFLVLIVWEIIAVLLTILTVGFFLFVWVLVEFVLHVVAAYDAYDQAEKINRGQVVV